MTAAFNIIKRKAIDISGRLGSFYDAAFDKLVKCVSIEPSNVQKPNKQFECKIFSSTNSIDLSNHLKEMDFDDALQLSLLCGTIEIQGISFLINYDQSFNENTRFLYYSYRTKEEELTLTRENLDATIASLSSSPSITHMICKILWGFEILCIISIPDYQSTIDIDNLLESVCNRLQNDTSEFHLTDAEQQQILSLPNVLIYSSGKRIHSTSMPLSNVLNRLTSWQKQEDFQHPLMYTMCALPRRENSNNFGEVSFLLEQNYCNLAQVKISMMSINKAVADVKRLFERIPEEFEDPAFDSQWTKYKKHFCDHLDKLKSFRSNLKNTLVDIRLNVKQPTEIYTLLSDSQCILLKREFETLYHIVSRWFTKVLLIDRLKKRGIRYINVMEFCGHENTPTTLEHFKNALICAFSKDDGFVSVFYSNNQLQEEKPDIWKIKYNEFLAKQESNTQKTVWIYADYSDCQQKLEEPMIVDLLIEKENNRENNLLKLDEPIRSNDSLSLQRSSPQQRITEINVLLIGESGVGKSTFINAFVNYLIFDTLQQAEQNEPVVLIPVSFLTTIGDNFEEFIVKFGNIDSNEDHEHQGQSVTQHCRSYVFHLNDRLILRLIDSPGIGDTRGPAQDDRNIDHIFTYINNLSHLNAVCLLLKPNASRLNIFFHSCINQLFAYLTPIAYGNIIFCFTNSRATFYAPGDTGPLLRQMLNDKQYNDIPYCKANIYCFDSESLRYLAARKRGVEFDEFQREECIKSWTTSVVESIRLLDYILTRRPYHLHAYQSLRKAIIDILMLVHPIMETLRTVIYNLILVEKGITNHRVILNCHVLNSEICSDCVSSQIMLLGPFYKIQFQNVLPKMNENERHQCISDGSNFFIEHIVTHSYIEEPPLRKKTLDALFDGILNKCNQLTDFLQRQQISNENDPFTIILKRFINEEHHIICSVSNDDITMNDRMLEILTSINNKRREDTKLRNGSRKIPLLYEIYEIIQELEAYDSVKKQIDIIKKNRRLKMKADEKQIKVNTEFHNKLFTKLINSF